MFSPDLELRDRTLKAYKEFLSKIEGERQKSDNLMNKLMEDKEFREMMLKKISEMGLLISD